MAKRYKKRYREYRGRRRDKKIGLKLVIALLAILLVAGVVFGMVLGGSLEYTDEGVKIILPWRTGESEPSPTPTATVEPTRPVVIIEDEPTPEPTPTPRWMAPIGAVEVTAAQVVDGSAAAAVAEAGGNALVVSMKGANGRLAWQSAQSFPAERGVNGGAEVNEAVKVLKEQNEELWLVARVVCFRDSTMVNARMGGPLMTRGGNQWYDGKGLCWVSPCAPEVTDYLTALCVELAELGFDEILLDCAGFPDFGETHVLATDSRRPEDLATPVAEFLAKVSGALEDSGAILSVLTDGESVMGTNVLSGMNADTLSRYAKRVWLPGATYAERTALTMAGMELNPGSVVILNSDASAECWTTLKHPYLD